MQQRMTGRQSFCLKGALLATTLGFTGDVAAEFRLLICTNCNPHTKKPAFGACPLFISFFCQGLDLRSANTRVHPYERQWKEKKVRYMDKKKLPLADK